MPTDLTSLLVALASFVVTFAVARVLAKWWKRRDGHAGEERARKDESRQVRRARERGKRPS